MGVVARVLRTRRATLELVLHLGHEDLVVQSMPDASPAKWHLAHTTWFFDRFVLRSLGLPPFRAEYDYLFNSYYDAVGARHPRSARGLLTRPSTEEVLEYRRAIDARIADLEGSPRLAEVAEALELGANHEEQHQELILTDLKHLFAQNPLRPACLLGQERAHDAIALTWARNEGGLLDIGHDGHGFSFDNERPRHKVFVAPFEISNRVVTEGEYLRFVRDGGYRRPELWLSEGFAWATAQAKEAPLYWRFEGARARSREESQLPRVFTLHGERELVDAAPVSHVSYYEADAYARWAGARLPTEAEWEASEAASFRTSDVWQWTSSAYSPYPGFRPLEGAFGEYNGKFMVSQMVLRGGSIATPPGHARATYRNFFPPSAEWQFSGIRLARDA
ncbi:MAG: ergothioneine biosynthesis protein EgtB [Deltaproteobacteria bacterium]|nr:ergothioneine biosynthesis protein EgtB [Deltaproteobacteria bacterium]